MALLKNLLQTRHKHECVLWSIGFHTRKLNIQGREKKSSKNISRQGCYWNSKKTFIWEDCYVNEVITLTEGLILGY